ncbi:carbohydrate kinase family protein [Faecalispora anaeroviscerum]|uniref:carbohydrate kinase family protein n=1 Tax=Faecalispora anaeroviscerum TaxID=2991836 RepID=UPI0024BBCD02|nr:carbohydrate kinase [Faecalispora anaeroviscerum]
MIHSNSQKRGHSRVLLFGEVLFDRFPNGTFIGGGPANSAAHLARLGAGSSLLSCVGQDELGDNAISLLHGFGVNTALIGRSNRPTGQVQVAVDGSGIPSYHIMENVAYDHIALSPQELLHIGQGGYDALFFGTMAQRSPGSRSTLHQLIESVPFSVRFLDINLRDGFYTEEILLYSLSHCTILKLNDEELAVLRQMLNLGEDPVSRLFAHYPELQICLVTKGAQGVLAYTREIRLDVPGQRVQVADTVGAGDAFSAAFLYVYLHTGNMVSAVKAGNHLGAYVASHSGAVPGYEAGLTERIASLAESRT